MMKSIKVSPWEKPQYDPLKLQRQVFRILGYYPGEGRFLHWTMVVLCLFNYSSQLYLCGLESQHFWTSMQRGEVYVALEVITPTMTRIGVLLKCFILIFERKRLKKLLDKLLDLHDQAKPDEVSIYKWVSYWSRLFTKFELVFFLVTCVFFTAIPLGVMVIRAITVPNEPRIFILPTQVSLPFDYQRSPVFELTFLLMTYVVFNPCFMLAGSDGLFIGVSLLVTSQFRVVQHQLESLDRQVIPTIGFSTVSSAQNKHILNRLKLIVQRHNQAIEIAHEMSSLFVPNVFTCYTIAAIKLGLTCLIILKAELFIKFIFIFGSFGILTEIFVYSYGGSKLMEESAKVHRSAYEFPWYYYGKDVRQLVQLMMVMAQRISRVELPFFEASIVTFGAIVQTAVSYMTLVKSFVET